MKKNEELLPTESICRELALLCNRVMSALEALIIDPGPGCPGIEDVKGKIKIPLTLSSTLLHGSINNKKVVIFEMQMVCFRPKMVIILLILVN